MARKRKEPKPEKLWDCPPVDHIPAVSPYLRAIKRAETCADVDMPCAFNHPTLIRAAGSIRSMASLGTDARGLPDYLITIQGRTGAKLEVNMLAAHVQIYNDFTEADNDVSLYKKCRRIKS
jgi:hypothetical protein